ncbi:MAG TPA: prolyl oligopeptidase family serine peptidase [Polyangiaceae bacterium]|nr:prolyl oligopeptidase family serine peptidase [Polyangiaceae bacterium]
MSLAALAISLAGAFLPLHATVRGGDIANATVRGQTVAFAALSRTKLEPGPATVTASAPGASTAIEVPHCGRRGAVTIDGTRYAPPPGPFVVRVAPRSEPHAIEIELTVSEYEKRVTCSDPIRAGAAVDSRDGLQVIDFASPAPSGGHAVIYVPPGHDTTKPSALLVGVHPWNGDIWTYAAYAELLAAARASDVVLVMPNGLGNSLYTAVPEQEVMRAIDATEHAVAIDPRRVSIWGASMGGQGACTIGLHHPDKFAFVASWFGDAKFDLGSYVRNILPTPDAAHRVNPVDVIDNARHVAIRLIHGDADRTSNVRESDELAAALRQRGYAFTYDRVPGRGHEGLLVAEHIGEIVATASRAQVPAHPSRVTFRSVRPEDDRAYGVRVVRSGTADAFVDVEQIGGRAVVHAAEGVRAIVLEDGALGVAKGAAIAWDHPHANIEARFE